MDGMRWRVNNSHGILMPGCRAMADNVTLEFSNDGLFSAKNEGDDFALVDIDKTGAICLKSGLTLDFAQVGTPVCKAMRLMRILLMAAREVEEAMK